jgi:hypothetical protein
VDVRLLLSWTEPNGFPKQVIFVVHDLQELYDAMLEEKVPAKRVLGVREATILEESKFPTVK